MEKSLKDQTLEELHRAKTGVARSPFGPVEMVRPDVVRELKRRRMTGGVLGGGVGFGIAFLCGVASPGTPGQTVTVLCVIMAGLGFWAGWGAIEN